MNVHSPAEQTDLLSIDALSKRFERQPGLIARAGALVGHPPDRRAVQALSDITLSVRRGEVMGLVGESGCGKSTLGRIVAGITTPSSGAVCFSRPGRAAPGGAQMIFQDPFASLNPRKRVRDIIGEAPVFHGLTTRREMTAYVARYMELCGIDPELQDRFPHQFSGGQRQRIGIARALAVEPDFLVCDECVASLDVSIQAQVLNLFMDLREKLNLTYLFISHDLSVIEHISDRIAVMYLGRIVETGPTEELVRNPRHPYTRALLDEMPVVSAAPRAFQPIRGEIPSPLSPPSGCHFHPRCPRAEAICTTNQPGLASVGPQHRCACHFASTES